jgi:hypothetical protein
MRLLVAVFAGCLLTGLRPAGAEAGPPEVQQPAEAGEGVTLTIYRDADAGRRYYDHGRQRWIERSEGWGVIKTRRPMDLKEGRNVVRFTDVAATIDPTTVRVKSLTDTGGTGVLEQNYEYDLVNPDKLLEKYIDKQIAVQTEGRQVEGKLLAYDQQQLVLQVRGPDMPVRVIARGENVKQILFSEIPGGLITQPTLVWHLEARQAGKHLIEVLYHADHISWKADYTAVISGRERKLDLSGWCTINNKSGATYEDAGLKLVAGDVQRVAPQQRVPQAQARQEALGGAAPRPQFEEKGFFEYHLYTLTRPTTLADRSRKQIELFPPASDVPVRKRYVYYGGRGRRNYGGRPYMDRNYGLKSNNKIDTYLEFHNAEDAGLGLPLPAGRVRVYKTDPDDESLEFIGEDEIDHTPRDEWVRLRMGSAFDIVGERRQTDFAVNRNIHLIRESFEIRIRNHKDEKVTVHVQEDLYRWVNWEITKSSAPFEKLSSERVVFPLEVPANGEAVLTYTVKYTW